MSCTVEQLIAHCEDALAKDVQYIYGAKWQVLSASQINALRNTYGSNCVWWSDSNKAGRLCCDCSGLISSATGTVRGSGQYKSSAVEVYSISQRNSSMRGWAVWMNGHIGVYDGNNGYYAMDGSARNMVHNPLSKNNFTHICKLCDVDYGNGASGGQIEEPTSSGGHYNADIDVTYAVKVKGGKILPFVTNLSDYAGIRGKAITGIALKVSAGSVKYRVTTVSGKTYPWVTGCDFSDEENGYAGNGDEEIATVEIYLYSPNNDKCIYYKVSPVNKGYYSYQRDTDKGNGMDGCAGARGISIDRLQCYIR